MHEFWSLYLALKVLFAIFLEIVAQKKFTIGRQGRMFKVGLLKKNTSVT